MLVTVSGIISSLIFVVWALVDRNLGRRRFGVAARVPAPILVAAIITPEA